MSPAARDRALEREMRAEKNLHPALQTPDGHYKVRMGCGSLCAVLLFDVRCEASRQLHVQLLSDLLMLPFRRSLLASRTCTMLCLLSSSPHPVLRCSFCGP
jgi:hypothetical protein